MRTDDRDVAIGRVLEGVVSARRLLGDARRRPFASLMLTSSQLEALFVLTHAAEPITPSALAQRLGVTAGAVTQLLDGVKRAGLVEQVAHPDDARSRVIRLTASARAEVDIFEAGVVAEMRPHFTDLSTSELNQLAALLGRVGRE